MNPENALEEVSDVDVWSWHGKSPADLDFGEMLELRKTILSNRAARRELDRKIEELGEVKAGKSEESQKHGIANWLRGDHLQSRAYLESAPAGEILAFAYAESILFGSYVGMAAKPNRPKLAVDALAKIARPSHETTTLHLKALRAADRSEDAANVFKSAGSAYAETADGKWYAGLMLEDQDLYEEAEASYEEGLAIDPTHVDCLFRKAYRRDMSSEDSEAVSLYERIAKQQPTHVNALINLGVIYEDSDRYHDAIYCYRRVIAAYPQHPRALLFLKDAEASLDMYYDEDQEVRQDKKNQILKIPVSDFELSVRSRNCLAKMNIVTLADLVTKTEPELLSYKNFGETSLNEIKQILDSKGLRLGMRPEDDLEPVQPRSASGGGDFARPAPGAATPAPAFNVDPNDARLQMLCSDMNLSVRSRKCLANLNIKTVGQLVAYTHDELLAQRNFGVTSLREITDQVEQMGLSMRTVDR